MTFAVALGIDRVEQTADGIQSLGGGQLTGRGTDTLSSIENASLAGGAGPDTIGINFTGADPVSVDGGAAARLDHRR